MLGLGDIWIFLAYVLCICSAILCVVYGFMKWNEDSDKLTKEDMDWLEEEKHLEEEI